MPANLTPQYQKAEEEYRKAQTYQEQVECLQRMLQLIPKHKGTEKLQADLKTRLKEARNSLEQQAHAAKKVGKTYRYPHQGAGQVVLLGAPNSGKSRLLAELTHAAPHVAAYPFSTREPLPGMMPWEDVAAELIDTPPITAAHFEPYLTSIVRSADMAVLAFDGSSDRAPDETAEVARQLASRKTGLTARSGFADGDLSTVHVKTLLVATRGDDPRCGQRLERFQEIFPNEFPVSRVELDRAESRETLRNEIYAALGVIRVYTKRPGHSPDLHDPYSLAKGATIEDLAIKVHRELAGKLKSARIWGSSGRDGQSVGRDHALADKDVVELHW